MSTISALLPRPSGAALFVTAVWPSRGLTCPSFPRLDNVMSNVPDVAICYHKEGIVQGYQLISTQKIPHLAGYEGFDPKVRCVPALPCPTGG